MTTDNDRIRLERENEIRAVFGVIAIAFGLLLLAIAAGGDWVHKMDSGDFGTLFIVTVSITFLISLVNLCRPRVLSGAILQALAAFATVLSALVFAFTHHDNALEPAALSAVLGGVLVAIGGISRINGEDIENVVEESVSGDSGRKYIYRDNRVVAVEEWVDGKLISTQAFTPTIAR